MKKTLPVAGATQNQFWHFLREPRPGWWMSEGRKMEICPVRGFWLLWHWEVMSLYSWGHGEDSDSGSEKPVSWEVIIWVLGFPDGAGGKEPGCQCKRHERCGFNPWVGKIPWRRKWQPTPVFLSGEFQGQRSLLGSNARGHKESNMTKQLTLSHTFCNFIHKIFLIGRIKFE